MRIVRFIIIFFISILLLILALVNRQYVDFRFLPINLSDQLGVSGSITLPLFILTFIGILVGVLLGFFGNTYENINIVRHFHKKQKRLKF